jgi:hypothetical protein
MIAFTLEQNGEYGNPTFYFAVQNSGLDPICYVDAPFRVFDANGTELANSPGAGAVSSPMYTTGSDPVPCLGQGEIGLV